jgi:hypothetical protein
MKNGMKIFLIILSAIILFTALIELKFYLANKSSKESEKNDVKPANIDSLQTKIKSDSLYEVKEVFYKDSGILISVTNPEKSGTDEYFNKKYNLNGYSNINMVYIYEYDSTKPIKSTSLDDAIMATGKKLGRFQEEWAIKYIDTVDKSCKPLKKYLQTGMHFPESFKNEETVYQPESISRMQVVCKYRIKDSLGKTILKQITAVIDTAGKIISTK